MLSSAGSLFFARVGYFLKQLDRIIMEYKKYYLQPGQSSVIRSNEEEHVFRDYRNVNQETPLLCIIALPFKYILYN